ncbi:MAG: hypothetical protein WBH03_15755 [Cyclobacteriaceae bacterium]
MEGVAVNTTLPTDPNRKLYNAGSDWQKETAGAARGASLCEIRIGV